jgi:hypothetical protein
MCQLLKKLATFGLKSGKQGASLKPVSLAKVSEKQGIGFVK